MYFFCFVFRFCFLLFGFAFLVLFWFFVSFFFVGGRTMGLRQYSGSLPDAPRTARGTSSPLVLALCKKRLYHEEKLIHIRIITPTREHIQSHRTRTKRTTNTVLSHDTQYRSCCGKNNKPHQLHKHLRKLIKTTTFPPSTFKQNNSRKKNKKPTYGLAGTCRGAFRAPYCGKSSLCLARSRPLPHPAPESKRKLI